MAYLLTRTVYALDQDAFDISRLRGPRRPNNIGFVSLEARNRLTHGFNKGSFRKNRNVNPRSEGTKAV